MLAFLKRLLFSSTLIGVAITIYIVTRPSNFTYSYSIPFDNLPKQILVEQLTHFEYWEKWAITDAIQFSVVNNKEELLNELHLKFLNAKKLKIKHEKITDSIIIQKVYIGDDTTFQEIRWDLGTTDRVSFLKLEINEQLSFKDKFYELIERENSKRTWLLSLHEKTPILQQQLSDKRN